MTIFETFEMLGSNIWAYGGAFILVLSILVFVHEWGHYIIARLCGVHVEVFSIGFGKELWGREDKAGTRWKFSLIPLGGYVKLFGDTDPASAGHTDKTKDEKSGQERPMTEEERDVAFFTKPVWKRAAIVFAGPAINYIFAIFILSLLFTFHGQPITPPEAAAVVGGSSADENGFMPGDHVISIDGKEVSSFEDIRREMMIALDIEKHFVIERSGEMMDIYASPRRIVNEDRFGFKHSRGLLGLVSPRHALAAENITMVDGQEVSSKEEVIEAIKSRFGQTFTITLQNADETQNLIIHPRAEPNVNLGNPDHDEGYVIFISKKQGDIFVQYPPVKAMGAALREIYDVTVGTMEALGQMITGTRSATELGGVIRIGALAGDMAKQGIVALILFTALLSINLGLINLFPVPMLDGGHLLFYAVEAALGRPIPEQVQEYAFRIGFVFLVGLMVFANLNDILQLTLPSGEGMPLE